MWDILVQLQFVKKSEQQGGKELFVGCCAVLRECLPKVTDHGHKIGLPRRSRYLASKWMTDHSDQNDESVEQLKKNITSGMVPKVTQKRLVGQSMGWHIRHHPHPQHHSSLIIHSSVHSFVIIIVIAKGWF